MNNGPDLLRRFAGKVCGTNDFTLQTRDRCVGFEVMPPYVFFPFLFQDRYKLFQTGETTYMMNKFNHSVGIHTWASDRERLKYNGKNEPNSTFMVLGERHCPRSIVIGGKDF